MVKLNIVKGILKFLIFGKDLIIDVKKYNHINFSIFNIYFNEIISFTASGNK